MLIKVRYSDNTVGTVDDGKLQALIASDRITAFRRSEGWAVIGRDRMRERNTERRRAGAIVNIYV
ncbi:GSU3473 family protein [Geobacter sp. SVR]|uniref:GSU3473 family protein n=1 Tax=Geobacter sp. SVR TaxID=2495594 RepID=UPI00143EF88E|nr:hypothetical protein [Geobacter sp. SVR]BCS52812.1 hypothetical protein GSVR_11200 [Geobacter sp. SVR]GCF86678.1 hypothetical protein GSbR_32780 [Geobacter sp. SVR]